MIQLTGGIASKIISISFTVNIWYFEYVCALQHGNWGEEAQKIRKCCPLKKNHIKLKYTKAGCSMCCHCKGLYILRFLLLCLKKTLWLCSVLHFKATIKLFMQYYCIMTKNYEYQYSWFCINLHFMHFAVLQNVLSLLHNVNILYSIIQGSFDHPQHTFHLLCIYCVL